MKLFALMHDIPCEFGELLGVYTTKELAQEALERYHAAGKERGNLEIVECDLDSDIYPTS